MAFLKSGLGLFRKSGFPKLINPNKEENARESLIKVGVLLIAARLSWFSAVFTHTALCIVSFLCYCVSGFISY